MAKKQGILIDITKHIIHKTGWYDDTRIEGMYVKFDGEIMPAVYVFPIENQTKVQELLNQLAAAKKEYDDFVADVYYKQLPKLR